MGNTFKLTRVKGRPMRKRFAVIQVREDGGLNSGGKEEIIRSGKF